MDISHDFDYEPPFPLEEVVVVDPSYGLDYYLCILLVNVLSFLYIFVKFYRLICYAKLTFEWLPMINPYNFPLSYLYLLTNPYFLFWTRMLPNLRFEKSSLEISAIVGLECMNAVLYFCVRMVNAAVNHLEIIEQTQGVLTS